MVFNVIEDIWNWLKGFLNIDVMKIAKMIPGASTLLGWMGIGSEKETQKKTELDKAKAPEVPKVDSASIMPDFSKVLEGIDWTQFDFGSMLGVDLNFGQKLKSMVGTVIGLEKGGMIGMSPFAADTVGKAIGLESGGLFTLSKGEFVLDNQASAMFLQAAQLLSGSNQGSQLIEGQREGNMLASAAGAPTVISAPTSTVVNAPSTSAMMLPTADPNPYNMDFSPQSRLMPA